MKRLLLLSFCSLTILISHAAVPDIVVEQLRLDVREAMMAKDGKLPPVAAVDETLGIVMRELNSETSPFELSPSELVDFRKESTSLTNDDMNRVMLAFKKGINNKPLPHLLAYYDRLREAGVLTPRQKIICHKLLLRMAALFNIEIPPAVKP